MTKGILLLHGFSGGPYEVEPLTKYMKEHTDYVIETPTFQGHGDTLDYSLKGYKAEHWLMDAELAFRDLSKKVDEIIVVGFSMGGLIALYLAKRYKVHKLVLLSAACKYIAPAQLLKDFQAVTKDALTGYLKDNELFWLYGSKIKNVPLSAVVQFMRIARMVEPYLPSITVPTFIVQGQMDGIVPWKTAELIYDNLGSKEKYLYLSPSSKHHICYGEDRDKWFQKVLEFIKNCYN